MADPSPPYLDAFPASTAADWRARVATVLKGRSADTLVARTYDGIAIAPLYPPASEATSVFREARGWSVLQRVDDPEAGAANAQALEDLGNGADGLHLVFAGALGDYGFGVPVYADLRTILADVVFDAEVPIEIDSADPTGATALALAKLIADGRTDVAATRVNFGIDAFAMQARTGGDAADGPALANIAKDFAARGFGGQNFVADARLIHAAGGSEAQELGYALAAAVAYLRLLDTAGFDLDVARKNIAFRLAIDADEFLGVAKLRALRNLFASIEQECGLPPSPCHIHAETAWRSMTRRDADVNMLRATLAVFAAAIGGADRITALPHTQAVGLPDAFARRVARNTQLVLREEANLDKVADPAAGSGGFEALTAELCEKGWDEFRRIEAAGGLAKTLAAGPLRDAVAKVADARRRNVAKRRDGITGVTEFPALGESSPQVLRPAPAAKSAAAFVPHRLAEPFEVLRDRSDALLARTGARPKVFLATMGPLSASAARTTFAKNLFEAGGFEPVTHAGPDTPDALADAFRASGARVACLCSSDAIYAGQAADAAKALAAVHPRVLLAGRPGEAEAALRAAGVTDFAFAGSDVLALLDSLSAET